MGTTVRTTYDEFDGMIRRGDFEAAENRHELLFGEICVMPPPDPAHEFAVDVLNEWSSESLPRGKVLVRVQGTIGIPDADSVPLPDLSWLKKQDYSRRRPLPEDVLLVIEVADSSLARDQGPKAKLYATAGINDYWIVNIRDRCVEIRREPQRGRYRKREIVKVGQEARPLAHPDAVLPVSRLFPD